jgi:hypothetical protein
MNRMSAFLLAALAVTTVPMVPVVLSAAASPAAPQSTAERQALASQIEQRFEVFPTQGGVVLRPKTRTRDVRAIELNGGSIAIDGEPVTGAELRRRLDGDADVILRLSYLDAPDQHALFEPRQPQLPEAPESPVGPASPPATPTPPSAPARSRRQNRSSSDRVRIGGGVEVGADEIVAGDVVAIGGGAKVDGQVRGEVVAIGGGVDLGPQANVEGDVTVIGGSLHRDPSARVAGEIHEIGLGDVNFWPGLRRLGGGRGPNNVFVGPGNGLGSVFALVFTLSRLAVLCILASIVLLFGRGYVENVSLRAASEPVKAGAVGLLIQLLFFPVLIATIVVMVVTIIGIPLLVLVPFALLAFALLFLVGFTAVAYDVGRLGVSRFGWNGQNPYFVAAVGVALVLSPVLLSRLIGFAGLLWPITWTLLVLGLLTEYVVWTVGLGAVALVRFDRRT